MSSSAVVDLSKWRRVDALLKVGLNLPPDRRAKWAGQLPPEDRELLPLLRALLARGGVEADDFMRRPAAAAVTAEPARDLAVDGPGQIVGPYRLLRELGSGGMGTVWLAERYDGALQRQVAVKMPLYGWAPGVAERLAQEREALAALEHPNIARLYDAGTTLQGRPFLAMEYVDGLPIDVYADERRLSIRGRVELLLQVARAVEFAHARLIVHRDLKPSNILVTPAGDARLLDFGAAKLLREDVPQDSALTREAGRALSPDYASPEQIHGEPIAVASDVYSLGVVLFELLTGKRPYSLKRQSMGALQAAIDAVETPLASAVASGDKRLVRELRGDLDTVVAKALKKAVGERYSTVTEFASDLRRWLNHEPVTAQRDTVAYRVGTFIRRHRPAVSMGALVFAALAAAAVITTSQMFEARRQRDEARAQAKRAEAEERFANVLLEQTGPGGRPLTREEMIDRSVELLNEQYANDPHFIADTLITISGRYMDLGNTAKELAALTQAESIARRLADPVLLLKVQCNTVETELVGGRLDRAAQRMEEIHGLLARAPSVPQELRITCLHADATLADASGDTTTAVTRIETAIALQEQVDRTGQPYRSLLSHAQGLYIHAGRPKDGFAIAEKTLAVLRATDSNDIEPRSGALHNEAVALFQMGEIRAALAREREAVRLIEARDPGQPVNPVSATVLGRLLTLMNQPREGEGWTERAVASARAAENADAQIFALAALAESRAGAGDLRRASDALRAAALLLSPDSGPRERAAVARARTLVALRQSDPSRAEAAAEELLSVVGYPDERRLRGVQSADRYLSLAASAALRAGRPQDAERLAGEALQIARQIARDPDGSAGVGEARFLLARARQAAGNLTGAREAIRGAARALGSGLAPDHPLALEAAALERHL